jgi:very-short-patch-repair endonuclease
VKVAVEYDGALHWSRRRADDRRRDAIRALGWTVIVVSAEDYYRHPSGLVVQVRSALRAAAA